MHGSFAAAPEGLLKIFAKFWLQNLNILDVLRCSQATQQQQQQEQVEIMISLGQQTARSLAVGIFDLRQHRCGSSGHECERQTVLGRCNRTRSRVRPSKRKGETWTEGKEYEREREVKSFGPQEHVKLLMHANVCLCLPALPLFPLSFFLSSLHLPPFVCACACMRNNY